MSKLSLRLQLAKALLKFATVTTDKGDLFYEGELAVGTELFVENEAGEMIPAEDGEYTIDENIYVVAEGKVTEIKPVQPAEEETEPVEAEEETPAETPNYEEAITALQTEIENLRGEIDALKAEIETLKKEATETSTEEEFGKQEKPAWKPAWKK